MDIFFTYIATIVTAIIFIPIYRVLKGPTLFDRILGATAIGTKSLVLICLVGFMYRRIDMFIDIALAYAILSFVTIIAVAKYFEKSTGGQG